VRFGICSTTTVYGVVALLCLLYGTRFAFVRYRFQEEMQKAINFGNGRKLDGRALMVRKAIARKLDMAPRGRGNSSSRFNCSDVRLGFKHDRNFQSRKPHSFHKDKLISEGSRFPKRKQGFRNNSILTERRQYRDRRRYDNYSASLNQII